MTKRDVTRQTAGIGLITRRSRVQIPPPLLRKVQVLPGLLFVLTPNTCEIGDGGTIVDRPALQYDCQATIWFPEQTLWIDQELGYVLKSDHHEVIAIDLTPAFDASIFETG